MSNVQRTQARVRDKTSTGVLTSASLDALRARVAAQGGGGGVPSEAAPAPAASALPLAAPVEPPLPGAPPLPPPLLPEAAAPPPARDALSQAQAVAASISAALSGPGMAASGAAAAAIAAATAAAAVPGACLATCPPLLGTSGTSSIAPLPAGAGAARRGGGGVVVGATAAAAAGLLPGAGGPGGLLALLAGVRPTRVLALLNALGEAELADEAALAELTADIAVEATAGIAAAGEERAAEAAAAAAAAAAAGEERAAAAPPAAAPLGRLIAVRIPRPRPGGGESVDPVLVRRARPAGAAEAAAASGPAAPPPQPALALLEDAPTAPRVTVEMEEAPPLGGASAGAGAGASRKRARPSSAAGAFGSIPTSARAFYERIFVTGAGGGGGASGGAYLTAGTGASGTASGAVGLLTDGTERMMRQAAVAIVKGERAAERREAAGAGAGAGAGAVILYGSGEALVAPRVATAEELSRDPLAGRTRGLGRIFLEFSTTEAAVAAQGWLSGRACAGRVVATTFVDEEAYRTGRACEFAACRGARAT